MDWLIDNPLASMYGPLFLVVYAVLIVFLIAFHKIRLNSLDWTWKLPPPQIPQNPDPYEIAYLRGGENEVARSVVFSLVQRGYLIHTKDFIKRHEFFQKADTLPDIRLLSPLERKFFGSFHSPKTTKDIFGEGGLAEAISGYCYDYERKLENEKLLMPPELKNVAQRNAGIAAVVILLFGCFKFFAAITHGRFNVIFLIIMAIIAMIILYKTTKLPRLSRRGRAYLRELQTAFSKLKFQEQRKVDDVGVLQQPAYSGVDPMLLMVGIFGVGALAGTSYDFFPQTFEKSIKEDASNPNYTGSSCSSSGCGSSSCGSSDGGGGSSCSSGGGCSGGGGCGGGGCGGGCGG